MAYNKKMPTEAVKVVVRKRPLDQNERRSNRESIVKVFPERNQLLIYNARADTHKNFTFDAVYDESGSQRLVYDETAFPVVDSVMRGYNGTIFAYGQTGCGKTYTMLGSPEDPGIIPNSFAHIFGSISESAHEKTFLVRCSYCEIYNEEIRDLLNYDASSKLELKENKDKGIFIKNLSMEVVKSITGIEKAMQHGNNHRITKETKMNEKSSRSHAIFTIYLETSEDHQGRQTFRAGKLNLVDLAGSERQKKTGASGDRLKEAIEINLSLSALGNVISALVDGKVSHVPYRDSKLTRLLQDSLGGNTKTVMIAVVSPADYNYDESLSTLRYASRAKFIQNKPHVNEDPKDALLRQYADEISRLKQLLEQRPVELPLDRPSEQLIERIAEPHERPVQILKDGIIQGGEVEDLVLQEKLKYQRAFRKKLKKQKQREAALLAEKERQEQEFLLKDHHFNSLQEEVEGLRGLVDKLREQNLAYEQEIKDLNHEFAIERESLLDNIRGLEHECDFLCKVVKTLMSEQDIDRIRRKSKFDFNNNQWKVPNFQFQNKEVMFPKLGRNYDLRQFDIQNKALVFVEKNTPSLREVPSLNRGRKKDHRSAPLQPQIQHSSPSINLIKKRPTRNKYLVEHF